MQVKEWKLNLKSIKKENYGPISHEYWKKCTIHLQINPLTHKEFIPQMQDYFNISKSFYIIIKLRGECDFHIKD